MQTHQPTAGQQIWNEPSIIHELATYVDPPRSDTVRLMQVNKTFFDVVASHAYGLGYFTHAMLQKEDLYKLDLYMHDRAATSGRSEFYCKNVRQMIIVSRTLALPTGDHLYAGYKRLLTVMPNLTKVHIDLPYGEITVLRRIDTGEPTGIRINEIVVGGDEGVVGVPAPINGKGIIHQVVAGIWREYGECPIVAIIIEIEDLTPLYPTATCQWDRLFAAKTSYPHLRELRVSGPLLEEDILHMLSSTPNLVLLRLVAECDSTIGTEVGLLRSISDACPKLVDFKMETQGPAGIAFGLRHIHDFVSRRPSLVDLVLTIDPYLPLEHSDSSSLPILDNPDLASVRLLFPPAGLYPSCAKFAKCIFTFASDAVVDMELVGDFRDGDSIASGFTEDEKEGKKGEQWGQDVMECVEVLRRAASKKKEGDSEDEKKVVEEKVVGWASLGPV